MGRFGGYKILLALASFAFGATAWADCTSPAATIAKINYNTTKNTFEYCDGTSWIDMKKGGSPSVVASITDTTPRISNPTGVAVYGNYAYVANPGADSIAVMDITNVNSPSILTHLVNSTLLSNPTDIFISGTYLYVINNSTLVVIDISSPATPTIVGSITDATNLPAAQEIFVLSGYAYITITNGIAVFNVSTPSSPTYTGKLVNSTYFNGAKGVYVVGNYAYVAAVYSDRLTVVNVTTKSAPTVQGSVQSTSNYLNGADAVVVSGNYAYVVAYDGDDLAVIDISNPSSPTIAGGILENGNNYNGWNRPVDICISGTTVFVVQSGSGYNYLTSVDISTPTAPAQMAYISYGDVTASYCAESGGKLIVSAMSTGQLFVSDSSSKKQVTNVVASTFTDPGSDRMLSAAVSGNYLYAVAESQIYNSPGYLMVYNITTPATPTYLTKLSNAALLNCDGIAVSGSNAFVVCDTKLVVFNITTPSAPTHVTTFTDATNLADAKKIFISGNYAYVTTGSSARLTIINISTPGSPTVTGTLQDTTNLNNTCSTPSGNYCGGIVVSGNYAYISAYAVNRLSIVNISNPAAPTLTGSLQDNTNLQTATDVKVVGNYAYVTANTPGRLSIVNVTTPASPTLAGSLSGLSSAEAVVVSGSYAFVARGYNPGAVTSVNISNPAAPTLSGNSAGNSYIPINIVLAGSYVFTVDYTFVSSYNISTPTTPTFSSKTYYAGALGNMYGMDLSSSGNHAYLVGYYNPISQRFLTIMDITNKNAPTVASTLTDNTNMNSPNQVDESGGYLFISDSGADALLIYNVTNPAAPTYSGKYQNTTYADGANDVVVVGNYAYVTACSADRLSIIDITSKTAPTLAGSVQHATKLDCAKSVFVSGNYAYVVSSTADSLTIIDITNKASPTIVGDITSSTLLNQPSAIAVVGNYAHIAVVNGGYEYIATINVSNPALPTYVASVQNDYASGDLDVVDSNSMIFQSGNTTVQFDISNPASVVASHKVSAATYCGATSGSSIGQGAITGNYYVGYMDGDQKLCIYKMAVGPGATSAKSFADGLRIGDGGEIEISGNYAFISNDTRYISAINISNPLAPTLAGSLYIPGLIAPRGLKIIGNYLYVTANGDSVFAIVDISNPASLSLVSLTDLLWGDYTDIYVDAGYAYVLSRYIDAITIVDVSTPSAPTQVSMTYFSGVADGPMDIFVSGNYAYVASDMNNSLTIINVSNKASPTQVSNLVDATNLSFAASVTVSGNYAYVGAGTKMTIVNVATPASPSVVGSVSLGFTVSEVDVSGTTAYVSTTLGMYIVDVSNPAAPAIIGSTGFISKDVAKSGSYAFSKGANVVHVIENAPEINDGSCTVAGQMDYNATNNVLRFCNGSLWKAMGTVPGAGGSGCTTPTAAKGALDFYSTTNRYRYCDGTNWITVD
ncbi:LVIVD repeat-containing protein [Bdellovibrio sp. HCB337]|uniref:LVIVD repeat-containing protein n=1 Tax=Bdellovibrio sp. HCB337 TaxID=3394358 RepID=UPI0039A70FD9